MLKKVQKKDLIKGKLYSDVENHKSRSATILMFDHFDEDGDPCFKYHSGRCSYIKDPDGLIVFSTEDGPFYELPELEKVNQSHD